MVADEVSPVRGRMGRDLYALSGEVPSCLMTRAC